MTDPIGNNAAPILQAEAKKDPIKEVSEAYEAIFLNQLVSAMRKTVPKEGGLIPETHAERVFQSMLDSEYSQKMAQSEQIGLSRLIYEQLLRSK